jgi:ribosomal protein S18 acetylase RimI-like enzyme
VEPDATVTDPDHPLVDELAERQVRWYDQYRYAGDAAAREGARAVVVALLPTSQLVELPGGFLWLASDGDRTHVHDVTCAPGDVPAVRELATRLAEWPLSVGVVPGEPVRAAFVADGTFVPAATTMRLDVTGQVPGEELAGRVELAPMSERELAAYVEVAVAKYAGDRERAGESPEVALATAERSFAAMFPHGNRGAGHHLFTARHDGEACGLLWLGSRWPDQAWVYDVEVDPRFRGRGLGAAVLAGAARHTRARGHGWLGLNVFAHNQHARSLYARLGYVVEEEYVRRPG